VRARGTPLPGRSDDPAVRLPTSPRGGGWALRLELHRGRSCRALLPSLPLV